MPWEIAETQKEKVTVHDPARCMNCGHHKDQHDDAVGCIVEGGTKAIKNEEGVRLACSCPAYVPAPKGE